MGLPGQRAMYCLNCNHQLAVHRSYKCPECGWPFNPGDPISFTSELPSRRRAALIEIGYGVLQVFGRGHVYAGKPDNGLGFMFGYWCILSLALIVAAFTGFSLLATLALTWSVFSAISSLLAAREASLPPTAKC